MRVTVGARSHGYGMPAGGQRMQAQTGWWVTWRERVVCERVVCERVVCGQPTNTRSLSGEISGETTLVGKRVIDVESMPGIAGPC